MLPPGGQMQVKRKVAPVESATSQSTALVDGGESDQHAAAHSPRMMNADLRCHWRVVSPGVYDRFLITITNFTVNPLSNTGGKLLQCQRCYVWVLLIARIRSFKQCLMSGVSFYAEFLPTRFDFRFTFALLTCRFFCVIEKLLSDNWSY